jgi:hypothetical protein
MVILSSQQSLHSRAVRSYEHADRREQDSRSDGLTGGVGASGQGIAIRTEPERSRRLAGRLGNVREPEVWDLSRRRVEPPWRLCREVFLSAKYRGTNPATRYPRIRDGFTHRARQAPEGAEADEHRDERYRAVIGHANTVGILRQPRCRDDEDEHGRDREADKRGTPDAEHA